MGHGGELILAGVLLYMALSGVGWRIPEIERPLGAFAAFFVQMQTMHFAWKLRNDDAFLSWYREGKGGAMMNDLEVVALDLKIWTGVSLDIEQVAGWLLAFSLIPVALAVLMYVYRERVNAFLGSLLLLDPD
jgi:membrane protein CcdC involved in cytochrome C biogenesis